MIGRAVIMSETPRRYYCGDCWRTTEANDACPHCGQKGPRPRLDSIPYTAERWRMKRDACTQYGYEKGCIVPGCDNRPILHHFVPRSKGGTDTVGNLVSICKEHEEPIHRATRLIRPQ